MQKLGLFFESDEIPIDEIVDLPTVRQRMTAQLPPYPPQMRGIVNKTVIEQSEYFLDNLEKMVTTQAALPDSCALTALRIPGIELDPYAGRRGVAMRPTPSGLADLLPEDGTIVRRLEIPMGYLAHDLLTIAETAHGVRVVDSRVSFSGTSATRLLAYNVVDSVAKTGWARVIPPSWRQMHEASQTILQARHVWDDDADEFSMDDHRDALAQLDALPVEYRNEPRVVRLREQLDNYTRGTSVQTLLANMRMSLPGSMVTDFLTLASLNPRDGYREYVDAAKRTSTRFGDDAMVMLRYALGQAYYDESMDRAAAIFEQAHDLAPESGAVYGLAIECEARFGKPSRVEAWQDRYAEQTGDPWRVADCPIPLQMPLTENRMQTLALQLTLIMSDSDYLETESNPIDINAFAWRALGQLPSTTPEVDNLAIESAKEQIGGLYKRLGSIVAATNESDSEYQFLGSYIAPSRESGRLHYRYTAPSGRIVYDEWLVADTENGFRIVDVVPSALGVPHSELTAFAIAEDLIDNALAADAITDEIREMAKAGEVLRRASKLGSQERYGRAASQLDAMPETYADYPMAVLMRERAAWKSGQKSALEAAAAMRAKLGESVEADVIAYLKIADNEGSPELIAATERLIKRYGPDPQLLCSLAVARAAAGQPLAEAMASVEEAIAADPDDEAAWYVAVRLHGQYGSADDTLDWLLRADDVLIVDWDGLEDWPEMEGFVDTPQHRKWLLYLGDRSTYEQRKFMATRPRTTL